MVPNMCKSPTKPWFMGVFNMNGTWLIYKEKNAISSTKHGLPNLTPVGNVAH
jgi:hypothetical protein